ncbi:unnamed protein product [Dibothriocephalus latus]|uniref:Uncharacterized protein n=1 Tax=Dibothriocephalus latus TaxID=60516 RepID=A0A3P6RLM6_DIBLA|nr:unnamed protein product [Dibothriocephalus latus]
MPLPTLPPLVHVGELLIKSTIFPGALRSPLPPPSVPEESRSKAPPFLASSVQNAGLKLTIHSVYDSTHANSKERLATNKSDAPHPLPSPINQVS